MDLTVSSHSRRFTGFLSNSFSNSCLKVLRQDRVATAHFAFIITSLQPTIDSFRLPQSPSFYLLNFNNIVTLFYFQSLLCVVSPFIEKPSYLLPLHLSVTVIGQMLPAASPSGEIRENTLVVAL